LVVVLVSDTVTTLQTSPSLHKMGTLIKKWIKPRHQTTTLKPSPYIHIHMHELHSSISLHFTATLLKGWFRQLP